MVLEAGWRVVAEGREQAFSEIGGPAGQSPEEGACDEWFVGDVFGQGYGEGDRGSDGVGGFFERGGLGHGGWVGR